MINTLKIKISFVIKFLPSTLVQASYSYPQNQHHCAKGSLKKPNINETYHYFLCDHTFSILQLFFCSESQFAKTTTNCK